MGLSGPPPLRAWWIRLASVAAIVTVAAALAGTASAQTPAPAPSLTDDFSAADQYVESVPTAGGPKAPGVGSKPGKRNKSASGKEAPAPLPPSVESSLQRQPEETAAQLQRIATSPDYGAPTGKLKDARNKSTPRVPTATVSAAGEGAGSTLTWLLLALLAITVLAAGTTAYRRYQAKKSVG
jgi:hypothetical protein